MIFTARAIGVVAPTGPTRGTAAIYLDGIYQKTISLRASSGHSRQIVYVAAWSSVGSHRIEIRSTSSKRIDLDAFVTLR